MADLDGRRRGVPVAAAGSVMATGILSLGLRLDGQRLASAAFLTLAGGLWLALAAVFAARAVRERERWLRDTGLPGSLTTVAATAVSGHASRSRVTRRPAGRSRRSRRRSPRGCCRACCAASPGGPTARPS